MPVVSRTELVNIFRAGGTQRAYENLIESTFNIKDDEISITSDSGLVLTPHGPSKKLLSFSKSIANQASPIWSINFKERHGEHSLSIHEGDQVRLYLEAGGRVGIGTDKPNYHLDVHGIAGMQGRVGTYHSDYMPADGQWHTILENLDGCHGFEIMAHINDGEDRRFGLTHALLLMSHGKRGFKNKVVSVEAGSSWLWGKFWNKIALRWIVGEANSTSTKTFYSIPIKSRTHYGMQQGKTKKIFFRVTKIWDRDYEAETYNRIRVASTPSNSTRGRAKINITPR